MSVPQNSPTSLGDQPIDVRRYVDAVRRGAPLIVAIVIIVTLLVFALSKTLPKTYTASTRLVYNPASSVLGSPSAESSARQLATYQSIVKVPTVLAAAAHIVSEPEEAIREATSSSADSSANILTITSTANAASTAAARANAVTTAFIAEEQAIQHRGVAAARGQLEAELARLRPLPNSAAEIAALESRISALQISATSTGAELQIAERASVPTSPTSPRAGLNAVIAFVVSLFLAILVVLARDQLRPRYSDTREIGSALGLPVLAGIPYRPSLATAHRRMAVSGMEREGYDLLGAAVRLLEIPGTERRSLLISSATHGEGKTTVAANLARALSRTGGRTLVISGDMRSPALHQHFGVPLSPGLSDCLRAGRGEQGGLSAIVEEAIRPAPGERNLDVLSAGVAPSDPTSLLSTDALRRVMRMIAGRNYAFVIIDSPPLLG